MNTQNSVNTSPVEDRALQQLHLQLEEVKSLSVEGAKGKIEKLFTQAGRRYAGLYLLVYDPQQVMYGIVYSDQQEELQYKGLGKTTMHLEGLGVKLKKCLEDLDLKQEFSHVDEMAFYHQDKTVLTKQRSKEFGWKCSDG